MKHAVEVGHDNHIHARFIGDSSEADANEFRAATLALLDQQPDTVFDVLVDMTEAGTSPPAALKIYAGLMQNPHLNKIAFINAAAIPRAFANMAINFAHKSEVQFFETVEEAEKWL